MIRTTFSVWDQNMEFPRGRGNEWFVVGVSADKPDDESCNEPFSLEMACELIGANKQKEGVKVLQEEMEQEWDVGRRSGFPGCITLSPQYIKISKAFFQHSYMN